MDQYTQASHFIQSWAGNQRGASFIPCIGHEVNVTSSTMFFRTPIDTAAVYNVTNRPGYSPKNQSSIKTRSTKGATAENFNELRFEDENGSARIFIHAEKNLDTEVDEAQAIDHYRTKITAKHTPLDT